MVTFSENRMIRIIALYITLMICVTRFSYKIGEFAALGGLLFLVALWSKYKHTIFITREVLGYIKAYGIFILFTIPSILISDNVLLGIEAFIRMWILQYVSFLAIIFFVKNRNALVNMLTMFFIFSGVDCFVALAEFAFHLNDSHRGWGFGGCVLSIADVMCMILPLALVILMDSRFEKKLKKAAAFVVSGVIVGLLSNKSRGAWLTEPIVVSIAVYRYLKQNRRYLIIFCLVVLGIISYMATSPQYTQRVYSITNTTTDQSNVDRIWVLKSAKQMIHDHPVTGVGLGQFVDLYENQYKYEQESQHLPHAHNNFVQVTVETGIVGLLGFLYFVGYYLYTSLQNYRKNMNPYDLLIFAVFLAHICLFGQIDYTMWYGAAMQPFMWFLLALLFKLKETDKQFKVQ